VSHFAAPLQSGPYTPEPRTLYSLVKMQGVAPKLLIAERVEAERPASLQDRQLRILDHRIFRRVNDRAGADAEYGDHNQAHECTHEYST